MSITKHVALFFLMLCLFLGPVAAATITDNETASHDEAAESYQIHGIYTGTDFRIVQFKLAVLSHFSYLLISDGKVLVVDPGREINAYLDYAKKEKLDWVGTFLTHSHADFIAGHREMAVATGAPIYAGHKSGALYPHIEVRENDLITVGKAQIKILETPGHTPDGFCAVVTPAAAPASQEFVFSGDTLFVGSLGRPDLMGGSISAAALAGMMFDTWNNKLARLADTAIVLPAHGAGSLCGASLSDKPSSTIGEERFKNPYLQLMNDRNLFIARFIEGLDSAPAYFKENARINRNGPDLVDWQNPLAKRLEKLTGLIEQKDVYVVDIRATASYAEKHIPRSINIPLRGRFESWLGTIVPFKSQLILVGSEEELAEAGRRIRRVGYQADYMIFADYLAAEGNVSTLRSFSPADLHKMILARTAPLVVDVRNRSEVEDLKIGEGINIALAKLEEQSRNRLNPDEPVVVICNSAYRSSAATGLLYRNGFKDVSVLSGGCEGWLEAGLPVLHRDAVAPAVADNNVATKVTLPAGISAVELLRIVNTQSDTVAIFDIRTVEEFSDYSVPGARQIEAGILLDGAAVMTGDKKVIIVDKNGSTAFAVAALLAGRGGADVVALDGGVEAFWKVHETGFLAEPATTATGPHRKPQVVPQKTILNEPDKSEPVKKTKKGAGC